MEFAYPLGLIALASVIILIVLYLRSRHPKDEVIPSLMFVIQQKKEFIKYNFLRKLIRNLLFFIQIAVLALLSIAIASPSITIPYNLNTQYTVIVLDASASMNTKIGTATRFERAVEKAHEELSNINSIILSEEFPVVVLEDGSRGAASDILGKLNVKATKTNLHDAMMLANDILKEKKGNVVVISDFSLDKFDDIQLARKTLEANEHKVNYIEISDEKRAGNIGIIEFEISKWLTKLHVKNYNTKEENVRIAVKKDNSVLNEKTIAIPPNSVEFLEFETVTGKSMIELDVKDDFETDNIAYISGPAKRQIRVLLMTNDKNSPLSYALESSKNIELETVELPAVPKLSHDVIILDHFTTKLMLPGTFEDIKRFVKQGGIFILTAQEDLNELDFSVLNFIKLNDTMGESTVCIDTINSVTKQFEKDRCFAKTGYYYSIKQDNSSIMLALTEDKTPIIIIKGTMVYYGIDKSDFNKLPAYPIFWDHLLRFLDREESLEDLNVRSGMIKVINEQNIKTPSGSLTTKKVVFDEAGFYKIGDSVYANNLFDDRESDIFYKDDYLEKDELKADAEKTKILHEFEMDNMLIAIAIILLLFEMIYIKMRGDL